LEKNNMNIHIHTQSVQTAAADVLVVPVFEGESAESDELRALNQATAGLIADVLASGEIKGKSGDVAFLHAPGGVAARRTLLIGAGPQAEFSVRALRQRIGQAARVALKKGNASLAVMLRGGFPAAEAAAAAVEGVKLGVYDPAIYRKRETEAKFLTDVTLCVSASEADDAQRGVAEGDIIAEATNFSRTLSVEPGNKVTPREMARRAREMAEKFGLECVVFGREKMQELGMGALLGVGQGSDEEPQLIHLRYRPASGTSKNDIRLAIVGKGITFDTGGICIKSRDAMWEMKYDMSGGAATLGAMQAIAQLKPEIEVNAYVAAAENMPSGKSYKPGDVLHSYDGKTIEVIDTDAEGRLVLCDALAYARKDGAATHIIDLATLTGAVMVALGHERAGLMGTNPDFIGEVKCAAEAAGEKVWQLPLDEEYGELMKSDIADIKNLGNRYAGSITAGWFLREFVGDVPWVHLDIAGTAWLDGEQPEMAKGPTGFGVRTLVHLVKHLSA
jgi:leucyl aminopeptidase